MIKRILTYLWNKIRYLFFITFLVNLARLHGLFLRFLVFIRFFRIIRFCFGMSLKLPFTEYIYLSIYKFYALCILPIIRILVVFLRDFCVFIWYTIPAFLLYSYNYFFEIWIVKMFYNGFFLKNKKIFQNYFNYFKRNSKRRIVDFIWHYLYLEKFFFVKEIKFIIKLFTYALFTYVLFYLDFWGFFYNLFFKNFISVFFNQVFVFDFFTLSGFVNLFLLLLNLDVFFIIVYVFFLDFYENFFFLDFYENFLFIGLLFTDFFLHFKVGDYNNVSFFSVFINSMLFVNKSYFINSILQFFFINSDYMFFFFGCLFFFTVILSWFFFSYLGLYGIFSLNLVTLLLFWLSLLFSAKAIFLQQKIFTIKLCSWVFLSLNVKIDYYFLVDTISFSFAFLTTTIALFVFIYAFSYFRYEPLVDRFLLFILSFVISMLFLVLSGNIIMLFLGWELIGFTSFCLINFWTTKTATLKSAFKAFTFNKVSDFFMFMFLISTYSIFYTFDILSINTQIYKYDSYIVYLFGCPVNFLEFLSIMLIGAAFIKSAQLGGHAWLPDSMEAPVPASSLIHSATLVSAGIYLILRFNFIFDLTQFSKFIIPLIGSITAAYGGVCAAAQSDIKKTLAYSTISHCGFLMVLCSTEMNEFTILYLYVHGFFKAGVFMCVGNVLRITKGYQDTRRMGGLLKFLPFEYFCAVIGVVNLAGLPFTFGFFIKHLLLLSLDKYIYLYYFVMFNCLIGAFSGLFYSFRLINYTFFDFKKGNKSLYLNLNRINYNSYLYTNSSRAGTLSIFFLFICSYIVIFLMVKYYLFNNYLFSDFMNTTLLTNYYSTLTIFNGYLLNFSYINLMVIFLLFTLLFSRYKKVPRIYIIFNKIFSLFILFYFIFFFFN